jgi:hypothetical protein
LEVKDVQSNETISCPSNVKKTSLKKRCKPLNLYDFLSNNSGKPDQSSAEVELTGMGRPTNHVKARFLRLEQDGWWVYYRLDSRGRLVVDRDGEIVEHSRERVSDQEIVEDFGCFGASIGVQSGMGRGEEKEGAMDDPSNSADWSASDLEWVGPDFLKTLI